jgi:hypothetical protein
VSTTQQMPPARRRLVPGAVRQAEPVETPGVGAAEGVAEESRSEAKAVARGPSDVTGRRPAKVPVPRPDRRPETRAPGRRPAADYASTRLVNFRIPVDLHDRFRALVREAEERHPRLRKQSLTELLIALLEEGPQTADEVAELIRRKRLAEHEER